MNVPTSVVVGPHKVHICYVSDPKKTDDARVFGLYDGEALRILVDKDAAPTRKACTILHEVLHGIHDVAPFTDGDQEERCIQLLAPALILLMQQNPELFSQLQALANQR